MKAKFLTLVGLLSCATLSAQENKSGYQFTERVSINITPVKNQASTGASWCFATTSFMVAALLGM